MQVVECKGSDFLLLERVSYGKESTPPEDREYKLYGQRSGVGTITDWLDLAIDLKKEGVRTIEADGSVGFHLVEGF